MRLVTCLSIPQDPTLTQAGIQQLMVLIKLLSSSAIASRAYLLRSLIKLLLLLLLSSSLNTGLIILDATIHASLDLRPPELGGRPFLVDLGTGAYISHIIGHQVTSLHRAVEFPHRTSEARRGHTAGARACNPPAASASQSSSSSETFRSQNSAGLPSPARRDTPPAYQMFCTRARARIVF